ncbi:MAG: hypothetical protein COA42_21585 [Alteromonadaceae bacterium]|nr:MAG: hypothetical protein COA42_21585 [Alteromonadaceae bacterium]
MNDTPYCTIAIPDEYLDIIRSLLYCTNQNEPWAQLNIDLFYAPDEYIGLHCFKRHFGSTDFQPFDLEEKTEEKFDKAISKFVFSSEKIEYNQLWNKARIDYHRGDPHLNIDYKIDDDLTGLLEEIHPCTFFERPPKEHELAVLLWPGLPKDHKRPRLIKPNKTRADVLIMPLDKRLKENTRSRI